MTHYALRRPPGVPDIEVLADDELAALERAADAALLEDGADGSIEVVEDEAVEPYEPEGPG